ncbi:MAG: RNA polymerase sigma factor [Verrucomicrobiales bacterium]
MIESGEPPDEVLAAAALQGDEEAFIQLALRYRPMISSLAARFFPLPSERDDATQEILIHAWNKLPRYRERGTFGAWLKQVSARRCLDLIRTRSRRPIFTEMPEDWDVDQTAGSSADVAEDPRVELLQQALQRLEPSDQMAISFAELEGRSMQETAELMQWSISKTKVRLYRARQKLKEWIQIYEKS